MSNAEKERSLLHAVVELFIERAVALREGDQLVFPSKFNREHPEYPRPPQREVAYRFAGPVEDIYVTLAVRLYYSDVFSLKDFWKNAAEFRDATDKECGLLVESKEGEGVLSIFFEKGASMNSKVLFLRFIHEHLQRRAITGSLQRERIYRCPNCSEEVENKRAVRIRLEKGLDTITCQFCDEEIPLIDLLEEKFGDPELLRQVRAIEEVVEAKKEQAVGITTAKAKKDIGEFDVFLAHSGKDKPEVEAVAEALKLRGLNPWFDKWNLQPGKRFAKEIERVLPKTKAVAVFVGESTSPWKDFETYAALNLFAEKERPLIPVLLPGAKEVELPLFLRQFGWVRFSKSMDDTEALDNLEWGITGKNPRRRLK